MNFGKVLVSFLAWVVLLGPGTSPADDTDVYFDPAGQTCGDKNGDGDTEDAGEFACVEPLIMLTLDMRSNAISSGNLCTLGTNCDTVFGQEVNDQLLELDDAMDLGLEGTDLTLFDAIRAVYASVFLDLEGVKLGLMVNHASGGSADGGAYVLRGFRSMVQNDTNGAKEELIRKMYSIPKPRETGGGGGGGTTPAPTPPVCSGSTAKRTLTAEGMTFEVNDIVVNEGDTGVFTITGSGTNSSGEARQVTWQTQTGSAESTDFTAASGSQTVNKNAEPFQGGNPKGQVTVSVPVAFEGVPEGSEAFTIKLDVTKTEKVKGKDTVVVLETVSATATVCDVAAGSLSIANATVYEGDTAQFVVTLSRAQPTAVTVSYQVLEGTASAATDFGTSTPASPLTIPAGQTSATISVPTVATPADSADETFMVQLTSASDAKITVPLAAATGTIRPTPATCEPSEISATDAHQYQGASLYFELFRYLTGGDVYLGHPSTNPDSAQSSTAGFTDFTGPANKNLDEECYLPGYGDGLDLSDPKRGILAWDLGGTKPGGLKPDGSRHPSVTEDPVEENGTYRSPITEDQECAGIFAIDMLFGVSNDPARATASMPT